MDTPNTAVTEPAETPRKGFLRSLFNRQSLTSLGIGFAFGMAARAAVGAGAVVIAAPALVVAIGAGAIGGVASSLAVHAYQNKKRNDRGEETESYTFKKLAVAAVFGMIGGGVADFVSNLLDTTSSAVNTAAPSAGDVTPEPTGNTPPAPVQPDPADAVAVPPVHGPCLPADVQTLLNAEGVSDTVHNAAERACSDNARIAAQGTKDLGYHLYNGIGIAKEQAAGYQLLLDAARSGNVQAVRDSAFILFHGNPAIGVAADPKAALEMMEMVVDKDKSGLARHLLQEWTATGESSSEITDRLIRESVIRETVTPIAAPEAPAPTVSEPVQQTDSLTLPDGTVFEGEPSQPEASSRIPLEESLSEGESVSVDTAPPAHEAPAPAIVHGNPQPQDCSKAVFFADRIEFHCTSGSNHFTIGDTVKGVRPPMLVTPAMGGLSLSMK